MPSLLRPCTRAPSHGIAAYAFLWITTSGCITVVHEAPDEGEPTGDHAVAGDAGVVADDADMGARVDSNADAAAPGTPGEPDSPGPSASGVAVSGLALLAGEPAEGLDVSLEAAEGSAAGADSEHTVTDADGRFQFDQVPAGAHAIVLAPAQRADAYSERTLPIEVGDMDLELGELTLPVPVELAEPTDVTGSSMRLRWTPSDAASFREYKLYRHTSSGLDETTGTLVHVATERDDVEIVDEGLVGQQEYFYRVFTLDEHGLLGGSNVVSATTLDPCSAYGYSAEILAPADGATGVSTDLEIRYRFSHIDIPDKYLSLRSTSSGQFYPGGQQGEDAESEWLRVTVPAGLELEFEIGWLCLESAGDEERPLARVTFTTAP